MELAATEQRPSAPKAPLTNRPYSTFADCVLVYTEYWYFLLQSFLYALSLTSIPTSWSLEQFDRRDSYKPNTRE